MAVFKKYEHNPAHLFLENTKYFITGATYLHQYYFKTAEAKSHLLNSIRKGFDDRNWILEDWVILNDHYHIMVHAGENVAALPEIIKEIHKFSAIWVNKFDNIRNRKVWYNYWDSCITYERSYYSRLNYIWYNPVKHGYCRYAEDYIYGSFRDRFQKERDRMEDLKVQYPWDKLDVFDI